MKKNIIYKISQINYYQLSATFGIIGQLLIFISELVVARFLGPGEFGKFALFILVVEFVQIVSMKSFALTYSIKKEISKKYLVYLMLSSIFISFAAFELVSFVCIQYNLISIESTPRFLFYIVAGLCLFDYFAKIKFLKNGKFNFVSVLDLFSVAVFVVFLLYFVNCGLGWFAFVYAYVARFLCKTVIYVIKWSTLEDPGGRPFNVGDFKFSLGLTLQSLFLFSTNNIDKLVVSRVLDLTSLGIYSRAQKLIYTPFEQVIRSVTNISFSRMNNCELNGKCWILKNTLVLILLTTLPTVLFIMLNSDFVVATIYGDKWMSMTDILSQIALIACLTLISIPMGDFLKSNGVVYKELLTNIIMSALIVIYAAVNIDNISLPKFANFLVLIGFLIIFVQIWQISTIVSLKDLYCDVVTVPRVLVILFTSVISYIVTLFAGFEILGALAVILATGVSFINESGNLKSHE